MNGMGDKWLFSDVPSHPRYTFFNRTINQIHLSVSFPPGYVYGHSCPAVDICHRGVWGRGNSASPLPTEWRSSPLSGGCWWPGSCWPPRPWQTSTSPSMACGNYRLWDICTWKNSENTRSPRTKTSPILKGKKFLSFKYFNDPSTLYFHVSLT